MVVSFRREDWDSAIAAIAYQKILEWQEDWEKEQKEKKAADALNESEDLGMGGMGLEGAGLDLAGVNWNAPLVKTVLFEDVTAVDPPAQVKTPREWLSQEKIWCIISTSAEDLAEIMAKNMTI
jgi:hypothetical protein